MHFFRNKVARATGGIVSNNLYCKTRAFGNTFSGMYGLSAQEQSKSKDSNKRLFKLVGLLASVAAILKADHEFAKRYRLDGSIEASKLVADGLKDYVSSKSTKEKQIALYRVQAGIDIMNRASGVLSMYDELERLVGSLFEKKEPGSYTLTDVIEELKKQGETGDVAYDTEKWLQLCDELESLLKRPVGHFPEKEESVSYTLINIVKHLEEDEHRVGYEDEALRICKLISEKPETSWFSSKPSKNTPRS